MKIIIIEGLDNTGKTTLIQGLHEYYQSHNLSVQRIHFSAPTGKDTFEELARKQNTEYMDMATSLVDMASADLIDVVIIDRCWYSEYVYGQMYRERSAESVWKNISDVENILTIYFDEKDISLVLLDVNDINFSVKHEDGLSISKADADKIAVEQKLFNEVFLKSTLTNKLHLVVNDGNNFKDKGLLLNTVINTVQN